jgi:hypothetical protein
MAGWCAAAGGAIPTAAATPGTPVCPSGFHRQGAFAADPAAEAALERQCCIPLTVTATECTQAGNRVVAGSGTSLETRCSDGSVLRAFIAGTPSSVCCE